MGALLTRVWIAGTYLSELVRRGLPREVGPLDEHIVFILDGVGGFQFVPLLARKVIQESGLTVGSVFFRWQFGLPGEIFTDLCWHSRNRRQASRIADSIAEFHRSHPSARLHVMGFSAGAGLAVFACEALRDRAKIETLLLACPALSPQYNLAAALSQVNRCYALISAHDKFLLGWGTRTFGTVDRRRCAAAGQVGFRLPANLSSVQKSEYEKLREVHWSSELLADGHYGGHTGWACLPFLRKHLVPFLEGRPNLPSKKVDCAPVT